MPMCIAIIAHYLGPRLGIGQYLDRLLPPLMQQLSEAQIAYKILASPNAFQQTPALQAMASQVQVLEPLDYAPGKRYQWFLSKFAAFCQQTGITSVVWLSNPIVLPWHPASVAVIHDVNEWKAPEKYGSYLKTALRSLVYLDASLTFAQKVILVSQATYRDLVNVRTSPRLRRKLTVITNGSDSQLRHLPPVAIETTGHPYLLSVGRIDPAAKQLPAAVHLVEEMRSHSSQPWELHLVGGMNATTEQAGQAFLRSIQPLPWVVYHGYVDDRELAQRYRQARGIVFLADSEGFGLPVAEAASFGLWSVVNQQNQACIEAGGNALIPIQPADPQAAAHRVLARLEQPVPPQTRRPSWQDTAATYAHEIRQLNPH